MTEYTVVSDCVLPSVDNGVWYGSKAPGETLTLKCNGGYIITQGKAGSIETS